MRNTNAKLFRDLFHDRQSYRKFKKAYTSANVEKRLETIAMARRIKNTGSIRNITSNSPSIVGRSESMEIPNER